MTASCSEISLMLVSLRALFPSQVTFFWMFGPAGISAYWHTLDLCLNIISTLTCECAKTEWLIYCMPLNKNKFQTSLNISSSCLPVTNNRSQISLTLDCTVHLFLFLMFHEFVGQNRKNVKWSWHKLNVKFGSVASESYAYLRALSDILSYSRLKADAGALFSRYPKRGLPLLTEKAR